MVWLKEATLIDEHGARLRSLAKTLKEESPMGASASNGVVESSDSAGTGEVGEGRLGDQDRDKD